MAQEVAHLIGSEEVTGSTPVISSHKPLIFQGLNFFVSYFVLYRLCVQTLFCIMYTFGTPIACSMLAA